MRRIFTFVFSFCLFSAFLNNASAQCTSINTFSNGGSFAGFSGDVTSGQGLFTSFGISNNELRFSGITAPTTTIFRIISPTYIANPTTINFSFNSGSGNGANLTDVSYALQYINTSGTLVETALVSYPNSNPTATCIAIPTPVDIITTGWSANRYRVVAYYTVASAGTPNNFISMDNFSGNGATSLVVLPVKFANFTARKATNGVRLDWTIDAEENTKGYEVERSADGRTYTSVGSVAATGSRAYDFTDVRPLADGYYRIRAIDHDGKYGFSNVVRMRGGESEVMIKGFFNNRNQISVQHDTAVEGTSISVVTADGKVVRNVQVVKGSQLTQIDVSSAMPGLLVVRYQTAGKVETMKLVKQ
jgi:hypothetical protein